MQPVTAAEVADELYGLVPGDFTAVRDERARQVRAAGQRDEATAIKKLARPTASAWLVNQLARTPAEQMTRLYELGDELQEAQRALAGTRLRELSVERRQVVNELVTAAADLASQTDQSASDAVLGEVRATLEAALADSDARTAVRSGRLTKALAYAGLGEVDLSAAVAMPAPARPAKSQPADRAAESLRAAEEAAHIAAAALEEAERAVAAIDEQRQFLHRRISHLEQEVAEARTSHAGLTRDAKQAEGHRAVAARRLETANRQLDRARRAAGMGN